MNIKIYDLSYKINCLNIIEVKYKNVVIYYKLNTISDNYDDYDNTFPDYSSIDEYYDRLDCDGEHIFVNISIIHNDLIKKLYKKFNNDFNELLII